MKKFGIALIIALLLVAAILQWGVDRTPAGSAGESGKLFPAATGILDSLGGFRQYLAYVLYIKTDELHHAYYGSIASEDELVPYFILITMLDPNYVDAYDIGGTMMSLQGRNDEAIEFTLQGIANNPQSADLYYSLADIYLVEKRYEEARDAFANALERVPENVTRFQIMRGLLASYQALGDEENTRRMLMDIGIYYEVSKYSTYLSRDELTRLIFVINSCFEDAIHPGGPGGGTT